MLDLYDELLALRDDAVVRTNRAVALAELSGAAAALTELDALDAERLARFVPYLAARADLLRRADRLTEAGTAYAALLALDLPDAERRWLERQSASLSTPRGLTRGPASFF